MPPLIALDIGGTKTLVANASRTGRLLDQRRFATPIDPDAGVAALAEAIDALLAGAPPQGIGISIGGPMRHGAATVSPLHQPEWKGLALNAILAERYGCPVGIEVDTDAGALGEYHLGGARASRLLYLTISTGMGGGFLVDGEIYRGADGMHPEMGHHGVSVATAHPERVRCACGAPDCLEALVSGRGIERLYGRPAAALDGEQWAEVGVHLGRGLRNLSTILAPDAVVLAGGVALGGGAALLEAAQAEMRIGLRLVPEPRLRLSTLGEQSALLGAVVLAMRAAGAEMP